MIGRHRPPLNQQPVGAVWGGVFASMFAGGTRKAMTTSRSSRTYSGGGLNVQTWLRPPTTPNSAGELAASVPVKINARRALNRSRGTVN